MSGLNHSHQQHTLILTKTIQPNKASFDQNVFVFISFFLLAGTFTLISEFARAAVTFSFLKHLHSFEAKDDVLSWVMFSFTLLSFIILLVFICLPLMFYCMKSLLRKCCCSNKKRSYSLTHSPPRSGPGQAAQADGEGVTTDSHTQDDTAQDNTESSSDWKKKLCCC